VSQHVIDVLSLRLTVYVQRAQPPLPGPAHWTFSLSAANTDTDSLTSLNIFFVNVLIEYFAAPRKNTTKGKAGGVTGWGSMTHGAGPPAVRGKFRLPGMIYARVDDAKVNPHGPACQGKSSDTKKLCR